MKIRNADGSAMQITVNSQTASEWMLDANIDGAAIWVPVP